MKSATAFLFQKFAVLFVAYFVQEAGSSFFVCQKHTNVLVNQLKGSIILSNQFQRCEFLLASPNPNSYSILTLTLDVVDHLQEADDVILAVYDDTTYEKGKLIFESIHFNTSFLKWYQPVTVLSTTGRALISLLSNLDTSKNLFSVAFEFSSCPRNCSENGICSNSRCRCGNLWLGNDCSKPRCPMDCTSIKHGTCQVYSSGKCMCQKDDGIATMGIGCQLTIGSGLDSDVYTLDAWQVIDDYDDVEWRRLTQHASVYSSHSFWVWGGRRWGDQQLNDQLIKYDLLANRWLREQVAGFQPPARYLHSMNLVETEEDEGKKIVVYGGVDERNQASNQLFVYAIQAKRWKVEGEQQQHQPPGALFHASTVINSTYLYVITRIKHHMLLHRYSLKRGEWEVVRQRFTRTAASHLATSSASSSFSLVYDRYSETMIMVMASRGEMLLFDLRTSFWTAIRPHEPQKRPYTITAPSSVRSVRMGEFVVTMEGGRGEEEGEVKFYNLRCNTMLRANVSGGELLWGGTVSLMDEEGVLLVQGGGGGAGHLLAYLLPAFTSSHSRSRDCKRYKRGEVCVNDESRCEWCGRWHDPTQGVCVTSSACDDWSSGVPKKLACDGVCSQLDHCHLCTSYARFDSNLRKVEKRCGWCASLQRCFLHNDQHASKDDFCPEKLLVGGCTSAKNVARGIYALHYQPPYLTPNQVELINDEASVRTSVKNSRILSRGYFNFQVSQPRQLEMTFYLQYGWVEFKLGECAGVQTVLSSTAQATNSNVVTMHSAGYNVETHSFPLIVANTSRCLFEFELKASPPSSHPADTVFRFYLPQATDLNGSSSSGKKTKSWWRLRLEPFASDSDEEEGCRNHDSCMECASDVSCVWSSFNNSCLNRSSLGETTGRSA